MTFATRPAILLAILATLLSAAAFPDEVRGLVLDAEDRPIEGALPEEVEIVIERQAKISGRVVDRDGEGVPFAGIHVSVERPDLSMIRGWKADAEGRFIFENLEHGEALIMASTVDLETDDGIRPFSWLTDEEGQIVEIALGFAGPIRLRVEGTETEVPFRLAPGETKDLGTIVAPPAGGEADAAD